ncbi:MAG: shikimate kinase [Candidatus Altiarchaeia archaeon]
MEGLACAYGAASIANAIATGKGAAFGISLKTEAAVRLNGSGKIKGKIKGLPGEDTRLIELCAKKVLERFDPALGANIETVSNIPVASGLKSSSTAANAVVLAAYSAAGKGEKGVRLTDNELLDIAIDAALEAKVTITGAYDDAAASYYGGYVITDNAKRGIIKKGRMDGSLHVVVYVPEERSYTAKVDVEKCLLLRGAALLAWKEALNGSRYTALTANGLVYSAALGCDTRIPLAALSAGALASGISGKGPSVVALTKDDPEKIISAWEEFSGRAITCRINNTKAAILE